MDRPERPGPDADASEIQEWMDVDFDWAVAEGVKNAGEGNERAVVKVEIINHERGEVVGTIDTEGNLETESDALRDVSQAFLDEGIPILVPVKYKNECGETIYADSEVLVEPGTTGFVRAFVDELPSPFDGGGDCLKELPAYELE